MQSPTASLKGWKFAKWWELNKGSVRLLLAAAAGLVAASWPDNALVQVLFGTTTGVAVKLILDAVDFYFSDVKV